MDWRCCRSGTFVPVAKLNTIRLLVSLATSHSWPLHQLDVKNVFLNGDLSETIYMDLPLSFPAQGEYSGNSVASENLSMALSSLIGLGSTTSVR